MDRPVQINTHILINDMIPRFCDFRCRFLGTIDSEQEDEFFCILFSENQQNPLLLKNDHGHPVRCKPCLDKDQP